MKERTGVYICHCGGNISDYVDVEEISELLKYENGVIVSKHVMFACSDSNQKEMIKDIAENHLDSIVVASCSPKLHLHTFRNVAERAGINPFNYVQVNIREQCSWPHSDNHKEATIKAIGLIRSGINRVKNSVALHTIEIAANKSVLIIGAGVAGLRSAIELAKMGNQVFLIEKDYFIGGRIVQSDKLFMTNQNGKDIIKSLYKELKELNNISLFTGATIAKISGNAGNFTVEVKIRPGYINKSSDKNRLLKAIEECPVTIPDDFNYGMTSRKAIYKNYPEAYPDIHVADRERLINEDKFIASFSDVLDINQHPEIITLSAGALLVASGFDPYLPKDEEYGYGKYENIVTLPEFKRILELNNEKLIYKSQIIRNVSFIYCVGSRQIKGANQYCSRFCCTSAIHTSINLKEKYKNITSFHLFRDIRTYGKQEILYEKSSKLGDIYIRFDEKEPPVIEKNGNKLKIKVKDLLTSKMELELEPDLVVLVTGMVPRNDNMQIAEKLKIPIGSDRFFNEIHPKLKPVETVIKGIFIGGTCQGPKNITESVQSALSGAAKINALICSGRIRLDPTIAKINPEACVWCGKCKEVCEYDAVKESDFEGKKIAVVNETTCKGCGICAPVCQADAIELAQYSNNEIKGMIDGFMQNIEIHGDVTKEQSTSGMAELKMKEYPQLWKKIEDVIGQTPKTIPQIASELLTNSEIITYHIMTMNKYNVVEPAGMDSEEEYYYYKLKK